MPWKKMSLGNKGSNALNNDLVLFGIFLTLFFLMPIGRRQTLTPLPGFARFCSRMHSL